MNLFTQHLRAVHPELERAIQCLKNEWCAEINANKTIPYSVQQKINDSLSTQTTLAGSLFLFSAHHFSPLHTNNTLAACVELLHQAMRMGISPLPILNQDHQAFFNKTATLNQSLGNHLISWVLQRVNYLSQKTNNPSLMPIFLQYLIQTQHYYCAQALKNSFTTTTAIIKHNYKQKTALLFCLPLVLGYRCNPRNQNVQSELLLELLGEQMGIIWQNQQDQGGFNNQAASLSFLRHQIINRESPLWLTTLLPVVSKTDRQLMYRIWQTGVVTQTDLYYLRHLYHHYHHQNTLKLAVAHEYRLGQQLISDLHLAQKQAKNWHSLLNYVASTR